MTWTIDEAARVMGMPATEVLAVAEVGDYHVVTTHDEQHTIVTADGDAVLVTPETTTAELAAQLGVNVDKLAAQLERVEDQADDGGDTGDGEGQGDGQPPAEPDPVPDADVKELLAWVGEDADRAARALEAEKARDKPRTTVVSALEKVSQA